MNERLVIDLDACRDCGECDAECSYLYHGDNNGVARLRELAAFEISCRRCTEHACVTACPKDALEEREDGVLKRYNMRCIGCFSCSHACPFGNIIPAAFQFRTAACDYCAGRANGAPGCVKTCEKEALSIEAVSEEAADLHLVGDNLAIRASVWEKSEPAETR